MDHGFYRAFEDRYRGSRELITERLKAYLPFLTPLKRIYQDYPVLDLGCGRGEWLQLLTAEGYAPMGVDLDEGMLEACQALGLPARKADALRALRELADGSLVAVSGFHIAEHIPFSVLQDVVAEALRVLRPGGLLILETPNAESLVVGTNSFYLDPTHEHPIPNLLLSFLTEHSGFARSKIVRLQEPAELHETNASVGIWQVLSGTSPDYSVVAQKQSGPEALAQFDSVFESAYGISLDQLAVRYDRALETRLSGIEQELATAMTRSEFDEAMESIHRMQTEQLLLIQEKNSQHLAGIQERYSESFVGLQKHCSSLQAGLSTAQHSFQEAITRAEDVQAQLNASLGNAHHWYLRAIAYEDELAAVRRSSSWRLTAPLRQVARAVYWPLRSGRTSVGLALRAVVPHTRLWVARRPSVHRVALAILNRSPWLLAKLRQLQQNSIQADIAANASDPSHGVIDHAPLTARGRAIENALQQAITKGQN